MGETEKQRVVFLSAVMCTGTLKTHTRARVLQVPGVRWYMVCVYYTHTRLTLTTVLCTVVTRTTYVWCHVPQACGTNRGTRVLQR